MNIEIAERVIDLFVKHGEQVRNNLDNFEELLNSSSNDLYNECFLMISGMKLGIYDSLIFDDLPDIKLYVSTLENQGYSEEDALFMIQTYLYIIHRMDYYFELDTIDQLYNQIDESNIILMTALAKAYYKGYGCHQDYIKAHDLMHQLYLKGFDYFDYELGRMYELGLGVDQNIDTAMIYYSQDTSKTHYQMGLFYFYGQYVERDLLKAKEELLQSKEIKAYYYLGLIAESKGAYATAVVNYSKGTKQYQGDCLYRLGQLEYQGKGCQQDQQSAYKHLRYSYYCRNKQATYELAVQYLKQKQIKEGLFYLQQADYLHSKSADLLLANYYATGQYVKKDLIKAQKYYKKAIGSQDENI